MITLVGIAGWLLAAFITGGVSVLALVAHWDRRNDEAWKRESADAGRLADTHRTAA